jgi:DNA polymerase-3 subunit gamma/tau
MPTFASFEAVVAKAAAERDIALKLELEQNVRLIRFEQGRIELQFTDHASPDLAGTLGKRLQQWTGERWVITIGRGEAQPTLHERKQKERARLVTDARSDPLVAEVMSRFPGAEIVDVRVQAPAADIDLDDAPLPIDPEAEAED